MAAATVGAQAAALGATAGGIDATGTQVGSAAGTAPDSMRSARVLELSKAKTCGWSALF